MNTDSVTENAYIKEPNINGNYFSKTKNLKSDNGKKNSFRN